ncbi:flavodoxin domain-containing protein [Maliponia aquimaris]|uniref:Protoporphyrinogen IX dehydrogenase [menaquinone] n=1 Tax=Maliponia aquimaris TaxID=1673631 RepID=A0A238K775_9RHOB|nr:flavodoxin domain-containing protein [Maliponia aquimaris]SMX38771.1 Protoporphyrinogen IX dehydrogenase [menaquinone] [Maliponia aquimaris]
MKLLIAYASTEGQTRKIARHVADRLADAGHMVELVGLTDAGDIDLHRFDRVILAASVHLGNYQPEIAHFIEDRAAALNGRKCLFLSVSLAAAGHEAEDWRGLEHIVRDFLDATGWEPDRVAQVAGAYKPSEYDIFRRFVMKRILATRDPHADPGTDKEYTDWPALDALVDGWVAEKPA